MNGPLPEDDPAAKKFATILIVDDDDSNITLLSAFCRHLGHRTLVAKNGYEAIVTTLEHIPDLIIMDNMMPKMTGMEAAEILRSHEVAQHIPIIMVTALDSREDRLLGISKGVNDFLGKPIDFEELTLRLKNNLKIKEYHDLLKDYNKLLEQKVDERTHKLSEAFTKLDRAHTQIRTGYIETIYRLTLAAEYKDCDTGEHIKRVSHYTREIAVALGLDRDFQETIFYAAPMHDIGKVAIPDGILLKQAPLNPREWEIMKSHSSVGAKILSSSDSPYLKMAEDIALAHHERWDGSGYPLSLKGEEIPLAGRIMNIADQYDALRSRRCYKTEMGHQAVLDILIKGDGRTLPGHFDPDVLEAFKGVTEAFREIYTTFSGREDDLPFF